MSPSKDRTLAAHVSSVVRVAKDSVWCWKEHDGDILFVVTLLMVTMLEKYDINRVARVDAGGEV